MKRAYLWLCPEKRQKKELGRTKVKSSMIQIEAFLITNIQLPERSKIGIFIYVYIYLCIYICIKHFFEREISARVDLCF